MKCEIYNQDCVEFLRSYTNNDINLTFLDPPFNQGKDYRNHDDKMSEDA
jgi:DNA modification methylase